MWLMYELKMGMKYLVSTSVIAIHQKKKTSVIAVSHCFGLGYVFRSKCRLLKEVVHSNLCYDRKWESLDVLFLD